MKTSFVIYGPTFDATDALFEDVKHLDNVEYIQYPIRSKIGYFFSRVHMNRLKVIPCKRIWNRLYSNDKNVGGCYIYCNPWTYFMFKTGHVNELKKNNPYSYHVAYLTDINSARKLPLKKMQKVYDDIFIFDEEFAFEHGISCYPLVYSKEKFVNTTNIGMSDVVFIGQSKGRTEKIKKIYDQLTALGLICDFWIVNESNHIEELDGLHFIDRPMDPHESICRLIKSKVVLELKSYGVDALSDRVIKAVVYGKNILTDNKKILDFKYYNPSKIRIFEQEDTISKDILDNADDDYQYNNEYSPVKLLEYLEIKMGEIKKREG